MPIAAVPSYLGQDFKDASPAMRFGMLLPIWTSRADQEKEVRDRAAKKSPEAQEVANMLKTQGMDAAIEVLRHRERNRLPGLFEKNDFAARDAWKEIKGLGGVAGRQIEALIKRQQTFGAARTDVFCVKATATAPFTTGLGNEHPLENGFAFLWPYGLPYLPGSGVKGVVRRAAQELASGMWERDCGWKGLDHPCYQVEFRSGKDKERVDLHVLDVLFGREPPRGDSNAVRGALSFWDVIPQIAGDSLMVEIMTPHQSHYYQEKRERKSGNSSSPHDSGQPNPISFLTVPPGSAFHFFVVCDRKHLERLTQHRLEGAPDLLAQDGRGKPRWQTLLEAAFEHAFEWLGFGAKTAVGYGAMKAVAGSSPASPGGTASQQGEHRGQKPAAEPAPEQTWQAAKLVWKPGPGELTASFQGKTTMPMRGESAQKLIEALGQRANKLRKDKELANVAVTVREVGGRFELVGLAK